MGKYNLFDELYSSYKECAKNKKGTINAMRFIFEKEKNLISLRNDLKNRTYKIGKSICFIVDKPKIREIFAADFKDRVIHHFFVRAIEKNFYKNLSKIPYSCIKNRGVHSCIADLKKVYGDYKYYLQVDIKNFFVSIDKKILYTKLKKYLPKYIKEHINPYLEEDFDLSVYEYLLEKIVFHNPALDVTLKGKKELRYMLLKEKSLFYAREGIGLPIGNYSSQFFANIYLEGLDNFVESLGYKAFRYVDDMVILGNNYLELKDLAEKIDDFLKKDVNQTLRKEKTKLKSVNHGLNFIGYIIKPYVIYSRRSVVDTFIQKLKKLKQSVVFYYKDLKIISFENKNNLLCVCASYFGHFNHSNGKHLIKKLIYKNSFLQYFFDFDASIKGFVKSKIFKNKNTAYNYYDKLFKNTILFFESGGFFIFKSKYSFLKDSLDTIGPENVGFFKIETYNYKKDTIKVAQKFQKNILIVKNSFGKYTIQSLIVVKKDL